MYDTTGQVAAVLDMPSLSRIFEIGPNYVLGLWQHEDDVEHVQLYELIKP